MANSVEMWKEVINSLQIIQTELRVFNNAIAGKLSEMVPMEFVHVPFKGTEIYLLHKAFIDSGGASHENYKTLLEKTVKCISNKTQKGFSAQSFLKYSDKVDPESKDNVKRFLQKMIRNIDSYD
jgi:hypothetical protein